MATAASASPGAAKTPAWAGPSARPPPAFARPTTTTSPRRASAPGTGRLRASLHLGGAGAGAGAGAAITSSSAANGSGLHVPPGIAPLALPKMAGARGTQKNVLLFYCEEMRELAQQVVARNDDIELRSISWRTFADGFPNLFISNAHSIRGRHVAFLASFSSPSVIFEQLSIIYALPKLFISSFTLILPF
ncbi:unnamed protein product, partial [Urochloa humidicola]